MLMQPIEMKRTVLQVQAQHTEYCTYKAYTRLRYMVIKRYKGEGDKCNNNFIKYCTGKHNIIFQMLTRPLYVKGYWIRMYVIS